MTKLNIENKNRKDFKNGLKQFLKQRSIKEATLFREDF